ncbi:MAG TPA: response regulator transcription factor [Candidatus Bathyarchaeia archaeon]|nr:response regulator transcription factor [Candidatus Bathyarchaeia archaeon]
MTSATLGSADGRPSQVSSHPLTVVLADDHALVRAGLRSLLHAIGGIEVVAEARDGHEAVELVDRLRPHLVLMDIAMPGLNGLEASMRIVKRNPGTSIIIVSMHAAQEYALQALKAGASGYVLKNADPSELERAVMAVSRGETYLSPAMSTHLVADLRRRVAGEPSPLERLSSRHREVLQLIAEGNTTKTIAARLNLSVKTIETHRAQLMDRLDIHDVPGLVRFAIRVGLIAPLG